MLINKHLRRIQWALESPSFLDLDISVDYYQNEQHRLEVGKLLEGLDQDPTTVNLYFESLPKMPMGRYFEQLIFFILQNDPHYQVHWENQQIIDQEGITRGEIDLVVESAQRGIEHWEIALKYYIQTKNSSQYEDYLGPSRKDFLAKKMKHLVENQLPQGQSQQVKEAFGSIPSKVFLKGELYFPIKENRAIPLHYNARANKQHSMPFDDFLKEGKPSLSYTILFKPDWIGPYLCSEAEKLFSFEELVEALKGLFKELYRPQLIAVMVPKGSYYTEQQRLFILPNGWPEN